MTARRLPSLVGLRSLRALGPTVETVGLFRVSLPGLRRGTGTSDGSHDLIGQGRLAPCDALLPNRLPIDRSADFEHSGGYDTVARTGQRGFAEG